MQLVKAQLKPDRYLLDSAEESSIWAGSTDVSALTTSVNHREGSKSISFAKSGTTQAYGQISRTFDTDKPKKLDEFFDGDGKYSIYLSSLTNVANVQLIIGDDATDNNVYQVADTALATGWNEVEFDIDSPTSVGGDGANWNSIKYIAIKVNFDASGNTLAGILVDAISLLSIPKVRIEDMSDQTAALDDQNEVLGTTADAAVTSDAAGTISAKLRGIVTILADVWDSVNNLFKVQEQDAPVAEDNDAGVILTEERYTTVVIEANATTTHVTGAGFLRGFVLTDVGASGNVFDIYNNTAGSGTKMISQLDTVAAQTGYYPVNRSFDVGLTTVLATGTAAKLYLIYDNRT